MGRQINFYANKEVERQFINFVQSKGYVFLYDNFENGVFAVVENIDEYRERTIYMYKDEYGKCYWNTRINQIDSLRSPVIEFSKTMINHEEKRILRGRIWVGTQYYDENGYIVRKDPNLIKEFESMVRWLKKRVPFQEARIGKTGNEKWKNYICDDMKELADEGYWLL